ncbi:DUF1811 family protein [Ferroacidibacillus organovorans]|uniref:DUF1811 domain-containing protein n=1 Tax=Ferroacidibacillus organovorans TaxID=1765683 RepID=A0A162TJ68_9BACL|nr:DUF1811 family protein [Ferroacidibacillus organovorans]KYP80859.1 hypothetical protein AYJ22_01505 [Ferroacidibacillus organovorans]OAG95404.1 hypothetical protein AYW79_00385 [Ferroacidibacillus organovorans]OPG15758.1 hypothetical protein B2M26_09055 [Ferroacidibacillus organovorans]
MTKPLREMNRAELLEEMERLKRAGELAYREGNLSEYGVLESRYFLTRSYATDPKDIELGSTYGIENEAVLFVPKRFNGVFVYGFALGSSEEVGYPMGKLVPITFPRTP